MCISEFNDPNVHERLLYAKYWQTKLQDNEEVDFPDSLATEVADATSGFSFAYLKEALCALIFWTYSISADPYPLAYPLL